MKAYPTNNGTLSIEGSAGQLFFVTNSMSGTIFSVNDVSGIPSIEVVDTGDIKLAQYSGEVYFRGTKIINSLGTRVGCPLVQLFTQVLPLHLPAIYVVMAL
jgi:hypothetical protein